MQGLAEGLLQVQQGGQEWTELMKTINATQKERWELGNQYEELGNFVPRIVPRVASDILEGGTPLMIADATGLAIGFVVDKTSNALGAMAKGITDANNAIIDAWASTGLKYDE